MNTIGLEPKTFGCPKVPKGLVHILLTFVCVMETNEFVKQQLIIICMKQSSQTNVAPLNVLIIDATKGSWGVISYVLVWHVPLAQVLPCSQLIFPSKTWFFGTYLKIQWQKSLLNQYLPHSESTSYQINSIKSCSSRSFQQHQRHIPIPPKISAMI